MQKVIIAIVAASFLTACGTTSGMKTAMPQGAVSEKEQKLDFSEYNTIIIKNFGDGTKRQDLPKLAGKYFADEIEIAIKRSGAFETVSRKDIDSEKIIVVSGDITKYEEGDDVMKFFIGYGVGSTYFDANISFTDLVSNEVIGNMKVDKNSWPLGGGIATMQTIDSFMQGAAKKISKELVSAKSSVGTKERK